MRTAFFRSCPIKGQVGGPSLYCILITEGTKSCVDVVFAVDLNRSTMLSAGVLNQVFAVDLGRSGTLSAGVLNQVDLVWHANNVKVFAFEEIALTFPAGGIYFLLFEIL